MAAKGVLRGVATWPAVKAHVALKVHAAADACAGALPAALPGNPGAALLPRGAIKSPGPFVRHPALPNAGCHGRGGATAAAKPRANSSLPSPFGAPGNGSSVPAFATLAPPGPALALLQSSWRSVVHHGIGPASAPASSLSFTSANTLLRVTRSMLSLFGSGAALFVASNAIPGAATVVHASEKPGTPVWPRTPWGKQAPQPKSSVLPPTFGPFEEHYYLAKPRSDSASPVKTAIARKLPGTGTAASGPRVKGVPSCTCAYTSLPLSASAHGAVGASLPLASPTHGGTANSSARNAVPLAHGAMPNSTARSGMPLAAPIPLSSSLPLRGLSLPALRPLPGTPPGAGPPFPPVASLSQPHHQQQQQQHHYEAGSKGSLRASSHEAMPKSSSLSPRGLGMGALGLGDSWDIVVPSVFDPVGPAPNSPGRGAPGATARSFTDPSGPDRVFQNGGGTASSKLSGSLPAPRWSPPGGAADSARKQSHGAWLTGLQAVGDWELVLMPEPAPDSVSPARAAGAGLEAPLAPLPPVVSPQLTALSANAAAEAPALGTFAAAPVHSSQQGFALSGASSRGSSPEHRRWGVPNSGTGGTGSGAFGAGTLGAGALISGGLGNAAVADVRSLGSSSLAASGRSQSWSLLSQELLQARQRHTDDSAYELLPQLLQASQRHTEDSAYEILPQLLPPPGQGSNLTSSKVAQADAAELSDCLSPSSPPLPGPLSSLSSPSVPSSSPSPSPPPLLNPHAQPRLARASADSALSRSSSPSLNEPTKDGEVLEHDQLWAPPAAAEEGDSNGGAWEGGGSLSLGEALCHSQTRARMAEEAAASAALASRQLEESLAREMANTFSLRQWTQMLELENMRLAGLFSSAAALAPGGPFPLAALSPPWVPGQALQAVESGWLHPDGQQTLMLQTEAGLGPVPLPLLLLAVTFALGLTAGMSGAVFVGWRCGILVLGTVP